MKVHLLLGQYLLWIGHLSLPKGHTENLTSVMKFGVDLVPGVHEGRTHDKVSALKYVMLNAVSQVHKRQILCEFTYTRNLSKS